MVGRMAEQKNGYILQKQLLPEKGNEMLLQRSGGIARGRDQKSLYRFRKNLPQKNMLETVRAALLAPKLSTRDAGNASSSVKSELISPTASQKSSL